ncbi:DHH family phosphoesterase [bacterium]|nr:DHH family phosphoesterase [bacterium]MBU1984968.1 DHH family phosphoesterase [bacterium]
MTFPETDIRCFRESLGNGARVLISTHIHPDADAIGSVLAAAEMVTGLGGAPAILLDDDVPIRCRILPGADNIISYPTGKPTERFRVGLIVDSGNLSRIGDVRDALEKDAVLFNVDHHLSNDSFGRVNFVDLQSASTTELLFSLCRELELPITPSLADNMFAGLLSDTGRFRYANVTPASLHVAGELVAAGARVTDITNALYFDLSVQDVRSMSEIYSTLEIFGDGRISMMFVRLEYLVEDPDCVVDLALSIRGVQTAALLSETRGDKIRVALRSRDGVNVARLAERFGGGGHAKAAGFRMCGTLESVRERLLPELLRAVGVGETTAALTEA